MPLFNFANKAGKRLHEDVKYRTHCRHGSRGKCMQGAGRSCTKIRGKVKQQEESRVQDVGGERREDRKKAR